MQKLKTKQDTSDRLGRSPLSTPTFYGHKTKTTNQSEINGGASTQQENGEEA